ncbi:MAG: Sec-independent protein translocase protein TatB [Gammaproteobacteria bacterium]
MFDFGFWEIILVMIIALLVVGPERLPKLAREVGLWVGKAKRMVNSVRSDIEQEIQAADLKDILNKQQGEIQELRGLLKDTESDVKSVLDETDVAMKEFEAELSSDARQEAAVLENSGSDSAEQPASVESTGAGHDGNRPAGA